MRAALALALVALVLSSAAAWAGERVRAGRPAASSAGRVHARAPDASALPRLDLERIARYYGPRGTIPGTRAPGSLREDFRGAARFDLEKNARNHGPLERPGVSTLRGR